MGTGEYAVLGLVLLLLLGGTKLSGILGKSKKKPGTSSTAKIETNTKADFQKQNIKSVESVKDTQPPLA